LRPTRRDLLLAALAAVLSGCTILLEAGPHDEGLMLAAAERIADGQVPYRDFWWNYGPGQPYLLGAITAVGGPSLLAWRIVRVLVDVLVVLLVAHLVDVFGPRERGGSGASRWAPAAAIAAAGAMAWPTGPGPGPPALAASLAALLEAGRRPAAAGVLAGVAACFRPEMGIAAILGVMVLVRSRRAAIGFAVTVSAGYLPFLVLAPGEFLDQTVGFLGIQDLQRLPFPFELGAAWPDPNKLLEASFPALLVAAGVGVAVWLLAARERAGRGAWALVPLLGVGAAYLLARTDEFHLVPLAAVLAVLAGIVGARDRSRLTAVGAGLVLAITAVHGAERQAGRLAHPGDLATLPGPVADGVRGERGFARDLATVADTISDVPGPVLVAPPRYDRVSVGAPLVNVLLRRSNPSRYDVVQPGVVTTVAVQREIARDLRRTRTPWVVRWIAPRAARPEPNGSGRSSGVTVLDRAIARDYVAVVRTGEFVVLRRRIYASTR